MPKNVVLETERLRLRPWQVGDAAIQCELRLERDSRVPPHAASMRMGVPRQSDDSDEVDTAQDRAIRTAPY